MLMVLVYPTSGALGIPISCGYKPEYHAWKNNSLIFATEKALPPKSKMTLSPLPELVPPSLSLFAELDAIVTLPETVTSTPPTVAAWLGVANKNEDATTDNTIKTRIDFLIISSLSQIT